MNAKKTAFQEKNKHVFNKAGKSAVELRQNSRLEELAQALSNSDPKAWEELYLLLYDPLSRFIARIIRAEDHAHDITQEVFISIWESTDKMDAVKNLKAYLFGVARNHALKYIRERSKESGISSLSDIPLPALHDFAPDEFFTADEMKVLVAITLERMPRQRRKVFEMNRTEGLTVDEIAKKLNISRRTVQNHIYSVTKELKEMLIMASLLFFVS